MYHRVILFAEDSPNAQPVYLILSNNIGFCCKRSFINGYFLTIVVAGEMFKKKCFDCHAIRLPVNSIFGPLESRRDLIQLKISEGLVSSQLLGSSITLFKGKTMNISFHQRRNDEISKPTLEKKWGECCRVGMGESRMLLCLSTLLCQFVPQLLINKNRCLNLKLASYSMVGLFFWCFFFSPLPSQDLFCR